MILSKYNAKVLNQASNGVKVFDIAADTTASKVTVVTSQLAAIANDAEKAGGFQQAFGPLGDILDIGDGLTLLSPACTPIALSEVDTAILEEHLLIGIKKLNIP